MKTSVLAFFYSPWFNDYQVIGYGSCSTQKSAMSVAPAFRNPNGVHKILVVVFHKDALPFKEHVRWFDVRHHFV